MNKKLAILLVLGTFIVSNCTEPISEVKDTIYSGQDNSDAETHFYATYDVIYDIVSTNGKLQKGETTILPSSAEVTFEDSTFLDGNGISFTVDFGPLGTVEPKGTLCQDGRYRAGKLHISANSKFLDPLFTVIVTISNDDLFFSGNGSDMVQVIGTKKITKQTLTSLKIEVSDAKIITENYELPWSSSRIIELVSDKGPGIWGDVYKVTGSANGVNRFGEEYQVDIITPLMKKMELGCAQTFVSGKLKVSMTNSNKVIGVNYDPYGNEACDMFAEADIQGSKTIFRVR